MSLPISGEIADNTLRQPQRGRHESALVGVSHSLWPRFVFNNRDNISNDRITRRTDAMNIPMRAGVRTSAFLDGLISATTLYAEPAIVGVSHRRGALPLVVEIVSGMGARNAKSRI
jgi:hypothetical protein